MRTKLFLILIIFTLFTFSVCKAQTKEYYSTGELKSSLNYNSAEKTGIMTSYHKNGKISSKGKLRNDYRQLGLWKYYHSNGLLRSVGKYEIGKRTGEWKSYYQNGNLSRIGNYENDYSVGEWKYYHKNGTLERTGNESYVSTWKYYYDNGQLEKKGTIGRDDEEGNWVFYYRNGNIQKKGDFLKGKKTKEWKFYSKEGILLTSDYFLKDEKNGEHKEYYKNGKVKSVTNYVNDKVVGVTKMFNESGDTKDRSKEYIGIYGRGNLSVKVLKVNKDNLEAIVFKNKLKFTKVKTHKYKSKDGQILEFFPDISKVVVSHIQVPSLKAPLFKPTLKSKKADIIYDLNNLLKDSEDTYGTYNFKIDKEGKYLYYEWYNDVDNFYFKYKIKLFNMPSNSYIKLTTEIKNSLNMKVEQQYAEKKNKKEPYSDWKGKKSETTFKLFIFKKPNYAKKLVKKLNELVEINRLQKIK